MSIRQVGLLAFAFAVIGGFLLLAAPLPQPAWYHDFADQRPMIGVPHALNVVSNAPFVMVGLWGLWYMAGAASRRPGAFVDPIERWPFWAYFIGLVLTGIGSAYYHADPTNERLTWDRLPLTLAFMGLFTSVLAERLNVGCAKWLLGPLCLLGAASVIYWDWSERHGVGDLRPYYVVQFFPLIVLPLLLLSFPPRYTRTGDLIASLGCYVIAKLLETFDQQVYTGAGFVSGHTLKHLVAGLGAYLVLRMLQQRRPVQRATANP